MLTIEKMRELLFDRNIIKVAKSTGIHYNTIYKLIRGETDPRYSVLKKLSDYLEAN